MMLDEKTSQGIAQWLNFLEEATSTQSLMWLKHYSKSGVQKYSILSPLKNIKEYFSLPAQINRTAEIELFFSKDHHLYHSIFQDGLLKLRIGPEDRRFTTSLKNIFSVVQEHFMVEKNIAG